MAKSKWEQVKDKLILIEGWAKDGLTDEQIAKNLGISKDTFYKYKKTHTDFSDALKKGKEIVDYEVENALLKRALGYDYEEKTYKTTVDKETGKQKSTIATIVKKHVPPDTTAQIFWLTNRKREHWKNKYQQETQINEKTINNVKDILVKVRKAAEND